MMNIEEINYNLLKINELLDMMTKHHLNGGNNNIKTKTKNKTLFIDGLPLGLNSNTENDIDLSIMDLDNEIYSNLGKM
jgi:hypothetical protein